MRKLENRGVILNGEAGQIENVPMGPAAHGASLAEGAQACCKGGVRSPLARRLMLRLFLRYQRQGRSCP